MLAFGGFDHNDNDEEEEVGRKQDHLREAVKNYLADFVRKGGEFSLAERGGTPLSP